MTPASLIREKPAKPAAPRPAAPRAQQPILTRAELAPCTCPDHCDRDHTDE